MKKLSLTLTIIFLTGVSMANYCNHGNETAWYINGTTKTPQTMTVSSPPNFEGLSSFDVTCDTEDAAVTLSYIDRNNEVIILDTKIVSDGVATLEFDEPLTDTLNLTLAVTGFNKNKATGLRISNSESAENEVYKNSYENLYIAQQFLDKNSSQSTKEHIAELTGLETYINWLQQLEQAGKTIYKLSEKELDYLIAYTETNIGRGVVFAQNILCELYRICIEESGMWLAESGEEGEEEKGEKEKGNGRGSLYENIKIHPNPTTGELTITYSPPAGAWGGINNVEVFDIYGKKYECTMARRHEGETLIDISHLSAGIYFIKVKTDAGEVVKKTVKQ